ncbi:MAG: hypothetical protein BPHS0_12 [Phage 5P_3]|nr:MAG: hypothetical protein BPHS0_12 [Phage 5P_3]
MSKWKVTLDDKKLKALPRDVRKRASQAVRETIAEVADEMRAGAPVEEGEMRDSITTYQAGQTKGVAWVDAEHAIHVEYGTAHNAAQPFIRNAVKAVRARFVAAANKVFGQ